MRPRRPLDDRELQRLLGLPRAPESLRTQLHATFAQQARSRRRRGLLAGGLAAVLLVSLSLMVWYPERSAPLLVDVARTHSQREAQLSGRFVTDYGLWLQAHYINAPPASMTVELAKYCELDGRIFLHLRLTTADSGPINLFLYAGEEAWGLAASPPQGPAAGWEALSPRAGLYALVLYEDRTARAQVDDLLRTMFPERALSAGGTARSSFPSPESEDQPHA